MKTVTTEASLEEEASEISDKPDDTIVFIKLPF